jgi:hypothetical protein
MGIQRGEKGRLCVHHFTAAKIPKKNSKHSHGKIELADISFTW